MKAVSIRKALKFGFHALIEHPFFFIKAILMSILLQAGLAIAGTIVAIPFGIIIGMRLKEAPSFFDISKGQHFDTFNAFITFVKTNLPPIGISTILSLIAIVIIGICTVNVISVWIKTSWIKISSDLYDKQTPTLSVFVPDRNTFFTFFWANLLFWSYINLTFVVALIPIPIGIYFGGFSISVFSIPLLLVALITNIYISLKLWFFPYFIVTQHVSVMESFKRAYAITGAPKKIFFLSLIMLPLTIILSKGFLMFLWTPFEGHLYREFTD